MNIVLKYRTGELVALDVPSGGYPYKTDMIQEVKVWADPFEARRYANMFEDEIDQHLYYLTWMRILRVTSFEKAIEEAQDLARMSSTGLARYRVVRTYDGWEWFRLPDALPADIEAIRAPRKTSMWDVMAHL